MTLLRAAVTVLFLTAATACIVGTSRPSDPAKTLNRPKRGMRIPLADSITPSIYDVELKPPATHQAADYHVFVAKGVLKPGAQETKRFILPKLARMGGLLLGEGVTWSFHTPSGKVIVPGETKSGAGYNYAVARAGMASFSLEHPEQGAWTLVMESSRADTAVAYAIDILSAGPAEETAHLEMMLRDSDPNTSFLARPGDPVFVRAFVAKDGRPMPGTKWDVRALTPSDSAIAIPVFDDGRHADGSAGDGVAVGSIVAKGPDGFYQLRAEVQTPSGGQYVVTGAIEVQADNDLLIADSIGVSPQNPKVGEPVTLTITALNEGVVEFKKAELELYVDRIKVAEQQLDLKPGESRRVATRWVPSRPKDFIVQLTLTSYDEPYGSDLTNNTRRTVVRVR
jgi:hypothetical protein